MLAIVGLGAVLVLLGCIWFYRTWMTEPANAPPLVRYEGSIFKPMILWTTDPGKLLRYAKEKYGDVFTLYMGFFKLTVFTDLDAFQWLPKATEEELSFSKNIKTFLRGMLGWETVKERSQEDHYERADKIGKVLHNHLEHFCIVMQEEVEKWAEKISNSGQAVDWEKEMDNLVMNINMVSFLGPDMTEENSRRFVELYDELETKGVTVGALLFHWLPWGNGARCAQIRKEISDILRPIIIRRQQDYVEQGITHEDYLNDFIVYPHKNEEPWTIEEIIERVISVFFAARVNTMKTLFWTTLNISIRPEVLRDVRKLVDNNEITYKNLKSTVFKYLDNVMRETVRPMYFTNPASRTNQKPKQYKQYVIPAGNVVGASAYFLNRDPQYFPEPEKFVPDRWHDDELLKKVWRFFGAGTHRCRGEQYATLKIRTVLHTLFKHYDVTWVDKKEDGVLPEYQFTFTLGQALTPVMVKLTPRAIAKPEPIAIKRGFPDDIPRIRKQVSDDKLLQHGAPPPATLRQQQHRSQQSQEEDDDRRAAPSLF